MVTMKDISKRAGTSIATVSAVINKSAYVSPELTERVRKAIEELNYRQCGGEKPQNEKYPYFGIDYDRYFKSVLSVDGQRYGRCRH